MNRCSIDSLRLAFATTLAIAAGQLAPLPAHALTIICDGECPAPSPSPAPAPPPSMPNGTDVNATFFAAPNGNTVQGGVANGNYFTFGGGPGTPYNGQPLYIGNSGSGVTLQTTLAPVASASASAYQDTAYGRSQGSIVLGYRVLLVAPDQAAADHISSLLGTSGAIAWVSGSYSLTGSGYGYGSVSASTGANGLASNLGASSSTACGSYGKVTDASTAGCGTGSFRLPVNFVAGSAYADGAPLTFVSEIGLSTAAQAGVASCCGGGYAGSFTAYIDPTITLASGIQASLILGSGGNVVNSPSAVPEPSQWAMWLGGLLISAAAVRRRQQRQPRG